MQKNIWRRANTGLIPSGAIAIAGAVLSSVYGNLHYGTINQKLISFAGIAIFLMFSSVFLHIFTDALYKVTTSHNLGIARAVAIKFGVRILGYIVIFFVTLGLLEIPVGRLLIGGAAVGIILGVAAQESLSNFFASVVLIVSHLYTVGDHIVVSSGPLGGKYEGKVTDIGLTHTVILEKNGTILRLPNSTMLSGAAIRNVSNDHR